MAPCLVDSLAVANIWPLFGIGMCHAHVVRRRCAGPFCPFRCFPRKGVGVPLLFGETIRCGLLYSVTESGIKPANRVFRQVCFWQVARCVHFVLLHENSNKYQAPTTIVNDRYHIVCPLSLARTPTFRRGCGALQRQLSSCLKC